MSLLRALYKENEGTIYMHVPRRFTCMFRDVLGVQMEFPWYGFIALSRKRLSLFIKWHDVSTVRM